jgi:hypothetical protein
MYHLTSTPSISKYFDAIDFFYNFDYSSYSKKCKYNLFCLIYGLLLYMYFKLDLLFYMFAITFLNKTNGQICKKKS